MDAKKRDALAKRLEDFVSAQAERLANDEVAGAEPRPWSIDDLKDARWLADVLKDEKWRKKRWPIITIFAVTALILTILLSHPSLTAVVIQATTADVVFELSAPSKSDSDVYLIPQELPVSTIDFFGQIALVPSSNLRPDGTFLASEWQNLRIDHVYVDPWPSQTPKVTVRVEAPDTVRICVSRSDLFVDVAGARVGDVQGDREIQVHVAPPIRNEVAPGATSDPCARWKSRTSERLAILSNLPVEDLHVSGSELVVAGENDRSEVFPSALQSAKLTFPEAPGLKYSFERDERLGLTRFRGRLVAVSLSKGFLDLRAIGSAARVTRSSSLAERNILPSRLALLRAKYSELWFAWGLLLYLVGLFTAFLKWKGVDL